MSLTLAELVKFVQHRTCDHRTCDHRICDHRTCDHCRWVQVFVAPLNGSA